MPEKNKPYFTISIVAEMLDIHPQTLRLYEREGLITPSRTKGKTRAYTREDLKRLETILRLTRELRVNIAGVQIILNLTSKLTRLQESSAEIIRKLIDHLASNRDESGLDILRKSVLDQQLSQQMNFDFDWELDRILRENDERR